MIRFDIKTGGSPATGLADDAPGGCDIGEGDKKMPVPPFKQGGAGLKPKGMIL